MDNSPSLPNPVAAADRLSARLDQTLSSAIGWLRFAEAKNAALLTFDAVLIFSLHNLVQTAPTVPLYVEIYVWAATVLAGLSMLLSAISFLPRTTIPQRIIVATSGPAPKSAVFYGHICSMSANDLVRLTVERIGHEDEPRLIDADIAEQAVIVSKLAMSKFTLFTWAMWFTVSALVTPVVAVVMIFIRRQNEAVI